MPRYGYYFIRECRDLLELFIVPGILCLLPHRLSWQLTRWLATQPWLYRRYLRGTWQAAQAFGDIFPLPSAERWHNQLRLVWLLGHLDFFLLLWRPERLSSPPFLQVTGAWPTSGGFMALGLHWGSGFLVFPQLRQQGFEPYFVFRSNVRDFNIQGWIEQAYRRWRAASHQQLANGIMTGSGAFAKLVAAVQQGGVPVVLFDAPPGGGQSREKLTVGGQDFYVAQGLMRLLSEQSTPFVLYRAGIDPDSGVRQLEISSCYQIGEIDPLRQVLEQWLEKTLDQQPSYWLLWPQGRELFSPATTPPLNSSQDIPQ